MIVAQKYSKLIIYFRSSVRDMSAENRGCLFSDERNIPGSEVSLIERVLLKSKILWEI